jgi:MFS family permease
VSWQAASQLTALLAGSAVGVLLTTWLPPAVLDAYGWRIAFLLGAAAVPFGLWLRTSLPETLHLAEAGETQAASGRSALSHAGDHWRVLTLGLVILGAGTIGSYIFTYIVTYAQATLHMSARAGFIAETSGFVIGIPAILLGGWLSDRYGRRPINIWGNLAFLVLIYPVFAWIASSRSEFALIAGVMILSAMANMIGGSIFAALAESLPKAIRGTGFGATYSISIAAFGGTTQLVVTWLIHVTGSALAPAWYLIAATGLGQIALMLMVESAPMRTRAPNTLAAAA